MRVQSRKNRKEVIIATSLFITLFILFLSNTGLLYADTKGLWATAWDLTSPEKIDEVISYSQQNGVTEIYAHVRYRSDALYTPNRFFSEYYNPEPRSYVLDNEGLEDFDPLAYIIEQTIDTGIDIFAWVTLFVATPHATDRLDPNHLYYTKSDWITRDFLDRRMATNSYEGAFIDPGVPAVQDYLINVFLDIVTNYPIKGIQLDYVRYPDSQFGYAPAAVKSFQESNRDESEFHNWKEEQVTRFVRRLYAEIKDYDPEIVVSADTISNLTKGQERHSQDWTKWLSEGIVDYVYPMSYAFEDDVIERELNEFLSWKERIIVGLRAWNEGKRVYKTESIESKMNLVLDKGFAGYALFSYDGVKNQFNDIDWITRASKQELEQLSTNKIIFGYVTDKTGFSISNQRVKLTSDSATIELLTDPNGFYFFNKLESGEYTLSCGSDDYEVESAPIIISEDRGIECIRQNIILTPIDK